jgi:hypothetical protein
MVLIKLALEPLADYRLLLEAGYRQQVKALLETKLAWLRLVTQQYSIVKLTILPELQIYGIDRRLPILVFGNLL